MGAFPGSSGMVVAGRAGNAPVAPRGRALCVDLPGYCGRIDGGIRSVCSRQARSRGISLAVRWGFEYLAGLGFRNSGVFTRSNGEKNNETCYSSS